MEITLALGGGGAKGNSHIGVLRRLEKEGFKIRSVAGTSFGGLVAILYASGRTPNEIEEIFSSVDQATLYAETQKMVHLCWGFLAFANCWILCSVKNLCRPHDSLCGHRGGYQDWL